MLIGELHGFNVLPDPKRKGRWKGRWCVVGLDDNETLRLIVDDLTKDDAVALQTAYGEVRAAVLKRKAKKGGER